MVRVLAVIPARYGSTRFPGKALARDTGKYLVQHVYDRVCAARSVEKVILATDDERIMTAGREFGAEVMMTREDHPSGTDRVAEVAEQVGGDLIVNVQGDEPEIDPGHIDEAVNCLRADGQADISTLAAPLEADEASNANVVKVVRDVRGRALYFSRSAIPYERDGRASPGLLRHLGLYVYRRASLLKLTELEPTPLERTEKLEQLRALEHGLGIAVALIDHPAVGIDTPEQYEAFVRSYTQAGSRG